MCVCVCVCILRFCWGLRGGLEAHWVSMGAHTTALPVLISSHAGEQWHQAGGLLEKQGTYSKYPHPPTDTHTHNPPTPNTPQHNHTFTDTHSGVWTNVSIWANFRAREEKICLSHAASVYRFSFCTNDKKINCSLENVFCFRVVLIMIKDREGE